MTSKERPVVLLLPWRSFFWFHFGFFPVVLFVSPFIHVEAMEHRSLFLFWAEFWIRLYSIPVYVWCVQIGRARSPVAVCRPEELVGKIHEKGPRSKQVLTMRRVRARDAANVLREFRFERFFLLKLADWPLTWLFGNALSKPNSQPPRPVTKFLLVEICGTPHWHWAIQSVSRFSSV